MKQRLFAVVLTLLLGGCGSIADVSSNQRIYGGIQTDVELVGHPYLHQSGEQEYFFPLIIFGILDFPLSLAVDTVLLPVTITIAATSEPKQTQLKYTPP